MNRTIKMDKKCHQTKKRSTNVFIYLNFEKNADICGSKFEGNINRF